jgi:hypothetical protein
MTSMLCVENYLDALEWAKSIGGLKALQSRADANAKVIADWVARTSWIDFLTRDPALRSNTSVCLKVVDPAVTRLPPEAQAAFVKGIAAALDKEGIAYDIDAYRDAPPGLRIWCGSTVERTDVEELTLWLDWAYAKAKAALAAAARGQPAPARLERTNAWRRESLFPMRFRRLRLRFSRIAASTSSFNLISARTRTSWPRPSTASTGWQYAPRPRSRASYWSTPKA